MAFLRGCAYDRNLDRGDDMRIGLLADLHANRQATEACLAALASTGCQRWVFLGDLVGYGADPE